MELRPRHIFSEIWPVQRVDRAALGMLHVAWLRERVVASRRVAEEVVEHLPQG